MENDDLSKAQEYKKHFFASQDTFFSKRSKFIYPEVKDTTKVLSNIANDKKFSIIRQRYKLKKFLSKFLLKSHLNWILYSYIRNNKLYIATQNHIGQSELNLQKLTILKYCLKSRDYNNIDEISIFRDEKYSKILSKNTCNIAYQYNFKERSYAIFDDNISSLKHKAILKNIKNHILRLNTIK